MTDLITAILSYYDGMDLPYKDDERHRKALNDLKQVLDNVSVLDDNQKLNMKRVLPLFSVEVLEGLTESLIRENLRELYKHQEAYKKSSNDDIEKGR